MPRKTPSPAFGVPFAMTQPWLMAQAASPALFASPVQHALTARENVLQECQKFTEAWCERHLEANAEVLHHIGKRTNGDGGAMAMAPMSGWAMKAAQTMSEDMTDAMTFWMNCVRHCMNETQPVIENAAEEVRERTAPAAQKNT